MGNSTSDGASVKNSPPSECPVSPVYNVYNERIDQRNSIPVGLHNKPGPNQLKPLSIERERSSIPKSGTEETWTYPSPQMFFNALKRKGKGEDIVEDDMDAVVFAHNST